MKEIYSYVLCRIDIGSSSIQIAAIDQKNLVYVMENIPHFGTPLKMLPNIWHNLTTNER